MKFKQPPKSTSPEADFVYGAGKNKYKLAPSPDFKPGSYAIDNNKIKSILDSAKEEDERKAMLKASRV